MREQAIGRDNPEVTGGCAPTLVTDMDGIPGRAAVNAKRVGFNGRVFFYNSPFHIAEQLARSGRRQKNGIGDGGNIAIMKPHPFIHIAANVYITAVFAGPVGRVLQGNSVGSIERGCPAKMQGIPFQGYQVEAGAGGPGNVELGMSVNPNKKEYDKKE